LPAPRRGHPRRGRQSALQARPPQLVRHPRPGAGLRGGGRRPQLTSLREELALQIVRIRELLAGLGDGKAVRPEADIWAEIRELILERARVVGAEARRLAEMGQTITKERLVAAFARVFESVVRHIKDEDTYAAGPRKVLEAIRGDVEAMLRGAREGG
jgi:hypothetical protein